MNRIELRAKKRQTLGKKVRFLRRQGTIPANMYGGGFDSVALQIDSQQLKQTLGRAGGTGVIALKVEGVKDPKLVMLRSIQRDPKSGELLHVDLYQVKLGEKIKLKTLLHVVGEAPAVKTQGGILLQALNFLDVECEVSAVCPSIDVDVSMLTEINQALLVKDIPIPEGMTILTDPEQIAVKIARSRAEEVPAVVAEVEEKKEEAAGAEKATAE